MRKLIWMHSNLIPGLRGTTVIAASLSLLLLGGCGDDPFAVRWTADVDTVELFSLARPELNLGSAYNLDQRRIITVEAPGASGSWDFAADDDGTTMFLVPPGALGIDSRAGIAPLDGIAFDDVTEAPADTALYVTDVRVPAVIGRVYAVRTVEATGFFGERCVFFGKVEPLAFDFERRSLTFRFDASPVCNDRSLVPTDEPGTL